MKCASRYCQALVHSVTDRQTDRSPSIHLCRRLQFINNEIRLDSQLKISNPRGIHSVWSGRVHQLEARRCIRSSSRCHQFQLIATLRRAAASDVSWLRPFLDPSLTHSELHRTVRCDLHSRQFHFYQRGCCCCFREIAHDHKLMDCHTFRSIRLYLLQSNSRGVTLVYKVGIPQFRRREGGALG